MKDGQYLILQKGEFVASFSLLVCATLLLSKVAQTRLEIDDFLVRRKGCFYNLIQYWYQWWNILVCAVCNDGSIQMWDHRKNFVNVCLQIETAHTFGSEITGVQFAYDNRMLATRSNDETLKLWDIRWFGLSSSTFIAQRVHNMYRTVWNIKALTVQKMNTFCLCI